MKDYPFILWLSLKIFRIISALIPHANLRRTMRILPFTLSRHAHQIVDSSDLIKANVFISMGDACKPALHLREYGLRTLSSPLDWMMGYSLDEAYRCFSVGFSDFFAECYDNGDADGKERSVASKSNAGMISIHAFPKKIALDEFLPTFRAQTKRRFLRIKAKILASQSVALVSARAVSVGEMADFGRKMQTLFTNWGGESHQNLIIINIYHNDDFAPTQIEKRVYKISDSLQIIEFYCNDNSLSGKRAFLGNTLAWHRIMCELAIKI